MRYVQSSKEGVFIRHIHDIEPTTWDENTRCYARRLTPDRIEKFGVSKLKLVTPPYFNPGTQIRTEGDAVLIDDAWVQTWIVTDLPEEEVLEKYGSQWMKVRSERDSLLIACDWTQLPDAPVDSIVWAAYRQALRDITEQEDPFNIVWPSEPNKISNETA